MSKVKVLRAWACGLILVALCAPAWCDQFDWRAFPGSDKLPAGNYITPVRNQGGAGTCWAFAAVAAVEANYDISLKILNSTLDLSEQNLVCAGIGTIAGGDEDQATTYVSITGITTESQLPYNQTNTSPNWPLKAPYTLYKITSMRPSYFLHADPTNIKSYLETYGPVEAAIDAETDFMTPSAPPVYGSSLIGAGSDAIPQALSASSQGGAQGGNLDHAILIVGFTDDPSVAGGGYWHVKNSWGSTWGPTGDGYGYISYANMQADNYLTVINGTSYTVLVPEPTSLCLLLGGLTLLRRKMKTRRAAEHSNRRTGE